MAFGSITNDIISRSVIGQPEPEIGMGVTMCGWSDRDAGTIVDILRDKGSVVVKVVEDDAKRVDKNGMSECQDYVFTPNPDGRVFYFKRAPSGKWGEMVENPVTGRLNKLRGGGKGLSIGRRGKYHDFSF